MFLNKLFSLRSLFALIVIGLFISNFTYSNSTLGSREYPRLSLNTEIDMLIRKHEIDINEIEEPDPPMPRLANQDELKIYAKNLVEEFQELKAKVKRIQNFNRFRHEEFRTALAEAQTIEDQYRVYFNYPDILPIKDWEEVRELGLIQEAVELGVIVPDEYLPYE